MVSPRSDEEILKKHKKRERTRGELSRYKLLMRYCALKAARHRDGHGSRLNSRGMQGDQECWPITQELCGPLQVKESDGWDFLVECIHRHETGAFSIFASFFSTKSRRQY